jgi:hypothetical protein
MSKSRSKSTATVPVALQNAYLDNLSGARAVADALPQRQFANFTQDYYTGQDALRGAAAGMIGAPTVDRAANAALGLTNFSPMMIQASQANRGDIRDVNEERIAAAMMNRGNVRDIGGGSFLNMNLGDYMNPFLQNVAGDVVSDMDRARQMQQMGNADQAAAARAFGGSRQGVLEAETNRNYYDRLGNTLSNLYATGFDSAANLAGQDLNRGLQANLANQGVDFNVGSLNTANMQQSNVQNAGNNLQAQQLNQTVDRDTTFLNTNLRQQADLANQAAQQAAAQLQLQAALGAGGLGQSQFDIRQSQANALMGLGEAQRAYQQNLLDAPRSLLLEQQNLRNTATGLYPGVGTNSSGNSFSILS